MVLYDGGKTVSFAFVSLSSASLLTPHLEAKGSVWVDGDDGGCWDSELEMRSSSVEFLGKVHGFDTFGT